MIYIVFVRYKDGSETLMEVFGRQSLAEEYLNGTAQAICPNGISYFFHEYTVRI